MPRRRAATVKLVHCENCGAELTGPYCAKCGQHAIDYRRSFVTLMGDAADAFFNLDARFFNTFALLFTKPWRLTNEFVAGRRHRYVHPLRVYLMASVVFFVLIKQLSSHHEHRRAQRVQVDHQQSDVQLGPVLPEANAPIGPWISPRLALPTASPSPTASPADDDDGGVAFKISPGEEERLPPWVRFLKDRAEEKIGPSGSKSDLFFQALFNNLPYMVLCCIPLFSVVLKLLYIRKRRFYIEHLIFALHTHAFVFLSVVCIIGIGFLLAWKLPALTALVCTFLGFFVVWELLMAIRRVYRQNWFATVFKFGIGSAIYLVLLGMAFGITAVLTLILP